MGFEQLAALKAQLTKEAKLKRQQEQGQATDKPATKKAPKPGAHQAPGQAAKPAAKPARPSRPERPARPERPERQGGGARSGEKAQPVDPVVRVIGKLQKRFPAAFPKNPAPKVPLKVGVLADLIAQASELQLSEAEIREAVSTWCRGSRYWACLTDGAARVDLAGEPAGVVTARDAAFARNQAKGGAGGRRKAAGKAGAAPANAGAQDAAAATAEGTEGEAKESEAKESEAQSAHANRAEGSDETREA
ncbi:ProQ/FinO family protein [Trinickia soli]|uniref:ProQ/FinO domain-containing protein n=1 Tax=Trinickia soli TaxID=380675 RepID=A0A2N7W642_9BURK|nr:ProQ/FinO family protein [Trinickia soli]KAA0091103.1 hypothetical protein CIW54_02745 [Paraburkholderia sp. T12-10]PMS24871.1 hypothetical protein C0Z19_11060 [Trinickia soli]CAB3645157.1 RNA chaperone ProQ [Trinickia soli]